MRWLLFSAGAAVTAQGVIAAAAPLLAASLTRVPWQIGLVAASGWIPWIMLGMWAGAVVDRSSHRQVMVVTDALRAVVLVGFAVSIVTDRVSVWSLGAVAFLVGVGAAFFDPAAQAEIPLLVGREKGSLDRANANYWSLDTVARALVGASVAGLLYAGAPWLPFLLAGVLLAASAGLVARLPARARKAPTQRPILEDMREGFATMWRIPTLRLCGLYMGAYNLAWNLVFGTLILVLLDHFDVSSTMWGLLVASGSLGGLIGGELVKRGSVGLSAAYGVGFVVQALGWLSVYFAPSAPWTVPGFMAVGAASTAVSAVGGTAKQHASPPAVLGRVTSVTRLFGVGAAAIGSAVSGVVASAFGLVSPTLLACVGLVVAASWASTHRQLDVSAVARIDHTQQEL